MRKLDTKEAICIIIRVKAFSGPFANGSTVRLADKRRLRLDSTTNEPILASLPNLLAFVKMNVDINY